MLIEPPFEGNGVLCGDCVRTKPHFTGARAALRYNDTSRAMILGFKHGDQTHSAISFVPWLKAVGAEFWPQTDIVMPIPLHRWRLFRRRYNQAALLALPLGKDLGIPVLLDGLIRRRNTPTQGRLRAKERARNVKSAFEVNPVYSEIIRGKTVTLIDDVYTTGSTVKECAKVLKKHGAREVYVVCVARVVRGDCF